MITTNNISHVKVSMPASSKVDHGFEHTALRYNSKYWLSQNWIMCPSGVTYVLADSCLSELSL